MPRHDPDPDSHRFALDREFLITAEDGNACDVGPVVKAMLSLRRSERAKPASEREQTHVFSTGMEAGMQLAIDVLYGLPAGEAFAAHCQEIEQFLADADTERL